MSAAGGPDDVAHLAVFLAEDRAQARRKLEMAGIGTEIHYPIADHRQPVFNSAYDHVRLPVTESAVARVLTVPYFPELEDREVDRVCEELGDI